MNSLTNDGHASPGGERRMADEIGDLLLAVRRGWALVAFATFVCLTVGVIYLARTGTTYKGFARVLVLQQGGRPWQIAGNAEAPRGGDTGDYIPTHVMIIKSPLIVRAALKRSGLGEDGLKDALTRLGVVRPDQAAKILEISYQSPSRDEALKMAGALVESYRDFLRKNYQNNANEVIQLITSARDQLGTEIKELEAKYLDFHRTHPVLAATEDGRSLSLRRLDQLDSAQNDAMIRQVRLKTQLELGRKLAADGKGLWSIASALKMIGEGADVASAAAGADQAPRTPEQLRARLAEVEDERRTAEQMVENLRIEDAALSAERTPSEDEIDRAFRAEPEAAALLAQLKTATSRRDSIRRMTRSSSDPSYSQAQRRVTAIQEELVQLYAMKRPALVEELSRDDGQESRQAVQKAEAELVVLKAQEKVLRERLAKLDADSASAAKGNGTAGVSAGPVAPAGAAGAQATALLDSIEESLNAIGTMRAEIRRTFEDDLKASKDTELDRLTEANLRSNLDRARAMFNSVVEQLKQAQLVSDYSSINAETLHEPDVTDLRPRWIVVLALALVAGLSLGTVAAFVADSLDARIRTVPEIRRALDLSVLGLVPHLPHEAEAVDDQVGLICQSAPRSMLAESYKSIRTNLEFHRRDRKLQVLLITSPHSGDGKSTSASNLAISLAHAGRKVLLVDADLRRPSQHLLYNLSRDRGLVHVLKGLLPVHLVTQRTVVDNLDFISCGPEVVNPAELLASPACSEFIENVRELYDVVLIDSSPLLAVTDPCVLGAHVDGVVLIVRANTITRQEAERTTEMLRNLGKPVVGTVINGITREQTGLWYGHGYGYGPSCGYGQPDGYGYGYGYGYGRGSFSGRTREPGRTRSYAGQGPPRALEAGNPVEGADLPLNGTPGQTVVS
ncbi:MAG: polysaccharide biosynthesis tyrosine autokinase [Isosphaeraceae bacterium]